MGGLISGKLSEWSATYSATDPPTSQDDDGPRSSDKSKMLISKLGCLTPGPHHAWEQTPLVYHPKMFPGHWLLNFVETKPKHLVWGRIWGRKHFSWQTVVGTSRSTHYWARTLTQHQWLKWRTDEQERKICKLDNQENRPKKKKNPGIPHQSECKCYAKCTVACVIGRQLTFATVATECTHCR